MECQANGSIVRAKELDTSFTIPKKRKIEETEVKPDDVAVKSILNDAYGVEQADGSVVQQAAGQWGYTDPYTNYYQAYLQQNPIDTSTLSFFTMREEPKNVKSTTLTYKDSFGDLYDDTLPKELKEQFQPLFCKLCSAKLGSTVNAKLHYASKNHDKKVRRFLIEYSEKTGEPLHKYARMTTAPKKKEDEEYNPKYYYCDVCDLALTGKVHAESHYMGKNHQKVVSGKKNPAGKGYYNSEGKYVRITQSQASTTEIPNYDGFGSDFLPKPQPTATTPKATSLRCELCQVSVTSLPQMDMHLQGQKHHKKMRSVGLAPPEVAPAVCLDSGNPPGPPAVLYGAYRTPSGQFYCKVCDLSLNSESQFGTHLQSKNHARKSCNAAKD